MASLAHARYTPEEYLEMERTAQQKSEYLSGEIFAMAGAGENHNLIVTNIVGELRARLKGKPCKTYPSDMKVQTGPAGLFAYPDVTVVCGQAEFRDEHRDTLLNPLVIVEVLSASTEGYDRGAKFAHYRRLDSLTDYILISSTERRIERFTRRPDNQWLLTEFSGDDEACMIEGLDCPLPMAEVYDRVTFD